MSYRFGDRLQTSFLPQSFEEYVTEDNPVRAYDAFVEALDLRDLGINLNPCKVGNSEYYPKSMLKLLVYGYSYGVKSSRKLERECHHNISFIWLMGGLKPDHKTIAEFRRRNKKALKQVLQQCARICIKLKLITGNVLFVDGTKIRANAARGNTHSKAYCEKLLVDIDNRVEQLIKECERADQKESGSPSLVTMDKQIAKSHNLKRKIRKILDAFDSTGKKKINLTDPDCAIMRSVQGSHASYNVQSVVDNENGLIVQVEAVSDVSDINQFAHQIEQANELFDKPCEVACADAGYADTSELTKIDEQGIKVIVPSQRQALHEEESRFSKSHFTYDENQDCYFCPEGHRLNYHSTDRETGKRQYRIANGGYCRNCKHYGQCTKAKNGRKIVRLHNEDMKQKFEAQYQEASSQEVYARRKCKVEHPFGHIKRNLKTDGFLLRGRDGVQAETSLFASCFNIVRMITIFGIGAFIERLATINAQSIA